MSYFGIGNPLVDAIQSYDALLNMQWTIAEIILEPTCEYESIGDDPRFSDLMDDIWKLMDKTWNGVYDLSPRARRARINLIWSDFVKSRTKRKHHKPIRYPRLAEDKD